MSGIAGIIGRKNKRDRKNINELLDKISHRGDNRMILNVPDGIAGINTNYNFRAKVNGNIILMDGRIYNLDDLILKSYFQKTANAQDT